MQAQALIASLLLFVFSGTALAKGPPVKDYPAERVAPHTYVIHGPLGYPSPENQGFMNNPAFVVTPAGVVVIDPGSSVQVGEMVLRQIRKKTQAPIIAVMNTHVHGDHWLGNQAIREVNSLVPIFGHPRMIEEVEKGAGLRWADNMEQMTDGASRGTRPIGPNIAVKDGEEWEFGGYVFRFHYRAEAHSDTDVMIEVPLEKLLFLGDNVNNERIVRMDDGTFAGSIAAVDAALQIPAEILVPGHGRTAGREMVHAYRGYLTMLYATVESLYDEGVSDFEMKPRVAERLAEFAHWTGFDDELGRHISLAYLEVEKKAFSFE